MLPLQESGSLASLAFAAAFGLPFCAVGGYIAYRGVALLRTGWLLWRSDPVSTVEAANAVGDAVELVGTAKPAGTRRLRSPFADAECVAYEWTAEEYDASGDDSSWDTLASGREQLPFRLEDDAGSILVEPEGADLRFASGHSVEVGRQETAGEPIASSLDAMDVEPGAGATESLGPLSAVTGERRRYSEDRLDVGETVHVYGPVERDLDAAEASGHVNAAVRADAGDGRFLLSDTSESSTIVRSVVAGLLATCFGLAFVGAGAYTAWTFAAAGVAG